MLKKTMLIIGMLALTGAVPSFATDPLIVTDASGSHPISKDGLIDFLNDLQSNPRAVTLTIFNHPFSFNPTLDSSQQATSITFVSPELGINKTFTGTSTSNTVDNLKTFLKSDAFLGPFYALINSGDGGTYSGTPHGTIGETSAAAFSAVLLQDIATAEEEGQQASAVRSITVGAGFSKFDSDGFSGTDTKVTPGYGWKLGEKKDHTLSLTVPIEKITVEGLSTFRAGPIVQFVKPFYLADKLVLRVGPNLSYSYLGSVDIPSYSGTIGGGLTSTLSQDWGVYLANLGLFYGRYEHLGGIDTGLKANVYSYGGQVGRRLGKRWVTTVYGIATNEQVNNAPSKRYETAGLSLLYRIFNRFNIEFSVNKIFGIPGYSDTSASFGSAWNF